MAIGMTVPVAFIVISAWVVMNGPVIDDTAERLCRFLMLNYPNVTVVSLLVLGGFLLRGLRKQN